MEQSLDEVGFLSRSENRVRVLDSLATESLTRRELQAETDASQATLSRILEDFDDRTWVAKRGATYEATAPGSWVIERFDALQQAIDVSSELADVASWLPTDVDGFDVSWLAEAEVITPTPTEPNAPMERLEQTLRAGSRVRVLSYAYNKDCLDANVAAVEDRGQRYSGIYPHPAVSTLRDNSEWRDQLESLLDSERVTVSVYDGEIPCSVGIVDDEVQLTIRDDDGIVRAVLVADSEPLLRWAESLYETYLRDSAPIDE
ncbi:hypothetical protein VB773_10920 [Haloarculaceae archaeon H-GB2-1]|nr:hypothetical protein [Haloarculaceae archaeon H-GB1-1]MEA5386505.1 hypothetical protein [Haloarculaceae archaeon H-GB11]MEA5408018.1 hypothetical protein [Haloarculaceae archaeon H-GB2-1]